MYQCDMNPDDVIVISNSLAQDQNDGIDKYTYTSINLPLKIIGICQQKFKF